MTAATVQTVGDGYSQSQTLLTMLYNELMLHVREGLLGTVNTNLTGSYCNVLWYIYTIVYESRAITHCMVYL